MCIINKTELVKKKIKDFDFPHPAKSSRNLESSQEVRSIKVKLLLKNGAISGSFMAAGDQ